MRAIDRTEALNDVIGCRKECGNEVSSCGMGLLSKGTRAMSV